MDPAVVDKSRPEDRLNPFTTIALRIPSQHAKCLTFIADPRKSYRCKWLYNICPRYPTPDLPPNGLFVSHVPQVLEFQLDNPLRYKDLECELCFVR